jgi:hypothetical protein
MIISAHSGGSFAVRRRPIRSEDRYSNPAVALLGQHSVNAFGLLDSYRLEEINLGINICRTNREARVLGYV